MEISVLVGGLLVNTVDNPASRLSKRITRKPPTRSRRQRLRPVDERAPSPITSSSGSPSPCSSYSTVIPFACTDAMESGYPPVSATACGGTASAPSRRRGVAEPADSAQYGDTSAMGLFKKRSADPAELDHLREEISSMAARLDAADADKAQIDHRIHTIVTRLDQTPPPAPPAPAHHLVDQADIDMIGRGSSACYDRLDEYARYPRPHRSPASTRW